MARKRRSKDLKKKPTTRLGRQPKTNPTPEWQAHFERNLGRKWSGHLDSSNNSPLRIMKDRGLLNGNTSALVSAGEDFRRAYIRRHGSVDAKSGSVGRMTGNGSISLPREFTDQSDIDKEQAFQEMNKRLFREGRNIHQQIIDVAVCENLPLWLQHVIDGQLVDINCKERDDLMIGLETLIN